MISDYRWNVSDRRAINKFKHKMDERRNHAARRISVNQSDTSFMFCNQNVTIQELSCYLPNLNMRKQLT